MRNTLPLMAIAFLAAVTTTVFAQTSLVESYLDDAHAALLRADYPRAERLFRAALSEANKVQKAEESVEATLNALNGLGNALVEQGKLPEAEKIAREHIKLCELVDGAKTQRCLVARANLAEILQRESKFEEAEQTARSVLTLREESEGPAHVDVGYSLTTLAAMFINQRKFEQAESLLNRAVAIFGAMKGADVTEQNLLAGVQAKRLLATCLVERRDYRDAETQIKTAMLIRERLQGPNSIDLAGDLRIYQRILAETHRTREANAVNRRATLIERYNAPRN